MYSTVDIWNMALAQAHHTDLLQTPDDATQAGRLCGSFWPSVRDEFLRTHDWDFARRRETLALRGDPTIEWGFSYALPHECLRPRRIESGLRFEDQDEMIPFVVEHDNDGPRILTDQAEAVLIYTKREERYGVWPPDAIRAVAAALAADLVAPLSGKPEMRGQLLQIAEVLRLRAAARNVNIGHLGVQRSGLERARD